MANTIDYANVDIPTEKNPENYHYTERRAEIRKMIHRAGSPRRISQTELAGRYDVTQAQISHDFDAISEYEDDVLGAHAKLSTRAAFNRIVDELLEEDDWRAKKAAWDVVMDWNNWLANIGEQHREPDRSELDVDLESRSREVSYTVVTGDGEELLGDGQDSDATVHNGDGVHDVEELGFTSTPAEVDVEAPGGEDE